MGNIGGEPVPGESGPPAESDKGLVKPTDVAKRYVSPPPREPDPPPSIIHPSVFTTERFGFEPKPPRTGTGTATRARNANDRAKGKLSGLDSKWRQETQEARERLTRNVVKVMRAGLRNPSDVAEAYANEPARTLTPEEIGQLIDEARERGIIDDAGHESLEEEFIPPADNSSPTPGKQE